MDEYANKLTYEGYHKALETYAPKEAGRSQNSARQRRRALAARRRYRRHCVRTLLRLGLLLLCAGALLLHVFQRTGESGGEAALTSAAGAAAQTSDDSLTDAEKLEIIESSDAYPQRLREFAEKSAEAIDYVYHYPECYGQHYAIDLSAEAASDTVPLLLQWDSRWGYEDYGDGQIGYTGCGPTCISMAALYLTGDAQWTPLKVAQIADENGYYVDGAGSSWTLLSEGVSSYGLYSEVLPLDESRMKAALDAGSLIVLNVGEGDFTTSGHFILVTGYDADGFTVNDPNSVANSETVWSYERLQGQIKNLWALSLAE